MTHELDPHEGPGLGLARQEIGFSTTLPCPIGIFRFPETHLRG